MLKHLFAPSFILSTFGAVAGEISLVEEPAPKLGTNGDWCDLFQSDFGTLYKNKDNRFIQKVKIFGRAHYQFSYVDGNNNGQDFDSDGGEFRRFRVGASIEFLDRFKIGARINIQDGDYREDKIAYNDFDELYLSYDAGDIGILEDVEFTYGRLKVGFGGEEHESSKRIKTVERSNLNNFFAPSRSTGILAAAEVGNTELTFGVFSTDDNREALADWNEGLAYYMSAEFEALEGDVTFDFIYSDADTTNGEENSIGYEWATSLTHESKIGNWELFLNATYGKTDNHDAVYGVVVMPSTFLIEDKLEAVVRYQYAASDADGVFKINSRAVRDAASASSPSVPIARGDENHTIYAGLNYYLCDHNAKVMVGAEYETLEGSNVDLESTTLWAAFRMYF